MAVASEAKYLRHVEWIFFLKIELAILNRKDSLITEESFWRGTGVSTQGQDPEMSW